MALNINPELKEALGDKLSTFEELFKGKNVVIELQENHIPKSRFDEVNGQVKDYKSQIAERDKQLTELQPKAKGHEELSAKITELTALNQKTVAEYDAKLQAREREYLLTDALRGAKARNPKAVRALLNDQEILVKEGKLDGLDKQLEAIRTSDPYLFEEINKDPGFAGRAAGGGAGASKAELDPTMAKIFGLKAK